MGGDSLDINSKREMSEGTNQMVSVSRYLSKEAARSTRAPSSFKPSIAREAIEV